MRNKKLIQALAVITACAVTTGAVLAYMRVADKLRPVAEAAARLSAGRYETKDTSSALAQLSHETANIDYCWDEQGYVFTLDSPAESTPEPDDSTEENLISCEFPSPEPSEESLKAIPYKNGSDNDGEIVEYFFTGYSGEGYLDLDSGGQVKNCTDIPNDELYSESQLPPDFILKKTSEEPQILIYHTHTTESFETEEKSSWDSAFPCKTTEQELNITAVGDSICKQLDKAGIGYVHDRVVHDYPSYDAAYDSSRESVQALLEEYPSIKIVLDVHRDGIQREDGTRLAPMCEVNGRKAAQIMIISGCDDGEMGMPNYIQNFHFACTLQSALETDWPGLTRPILFDYRHYNQDLTNGSLLIEVGSQANTIEQVKFSGELIGKTLAELFE